MPWDWIIALGEMGPRAKDALSQLRNELQQVREKWMLKYVTNALISASTEPNFSGDEMELPGSTKH